MNSISSVISAVFPHGITDLSFFFNADKGWKPSITVIGRDWMPIWPPDLFAFCATLIDSTGAYAAAEYFQPGSPEDGVEADGVFAFNSQKHRDHVQAVASAWNQMLGRIANGEKNAINPAAEPCQTLFRHWRKLLARRDVPFGQMSSEQMRAWQTSAMLLLVICDECCQSVGFGRIGKAAVEVRAEEDMKPEGRISNSGGTGTALNFVQLLVANDQRVAAEEYLQNASTQWTVKDPSGATDFDQADSMGRVLNMLNATGVLLPQPFTSLCRDVPLEVAVVQPKTSTPTLGCSLRSLTHHLALLPGTGRVVTHWVPQIHHTSSDASAVNLLLIPYPYEISGKNFQAFRSSPVSKSDTGRFFSVRQDWVKHRSVESDDWVRAFFRFVDSLVAEAQKEVDCVHGVVLPELSLTEESAELLAAKLADIHGLEFFLAGVTRPGANQSPGKESLQRHGVYGAFFERRSIRFQYFQGKHHRWKLDKFQISRYHLGDKLDPAYSWWEALDVSDRMCHFYPFRDHMCMTALVCEDLARADPVQPVIRAVGPNLMIVLLMDGPQLDRRWPSRYATIYADDPGTSVLTLTCRGMVRRSTSPGDSVKTQIALWRDCLNPDATELHAPLDSHALLLSLSAASMDQTTLDGRTLKDLPKRLSLTGSFAIRTTVPVP